MPSLMALRRSTSAVPPLDKSRAVVKPDSRSNLAFTEARRESPLPFDLEPPAKIRRVRVMRIQLPIATSWNGLLKEISAFNFRRSKTILVVLSCQSRAPTASVPPATNSALIIPVTSLTLRPRHCNRHLIWTTRPLRRFSPTHITASDSTARERDGILLLLLGS